MIINCVILFDRRVDFMGNRVTFHYVFAFINYFFVLLRHILMENGQFLRNAYGQPEMPNRPAYPEPFLRTIAPEVLHE